MVRTSSNLPTVAYQALHFGFSVLRRTSLVRQTRTAAGRISEIDFRFDEIHSLKMFSTFSTFFFYPPTLNLKRKCDKPDVILA